LARIVLHGVTDKAALLRRIGAVLGFPAWFGENWDALEDCLTDLSWREGEGNVLVLEGFQLLPPEDLGVLIEVMVCAAEFWGRPRQAVLRGLRRSGARARAREPLRRSMSHKLPLSVLVVIHTAELEVLLLERARRPATGSR
jgi:hypothetical protein